LTFQEVPIMDIELPANQQTAFYNTVWKIVRQIPPGKVSTYGQIAGYIPCPPGVPEDQYPALRARWVGQAMSASPSGVPWQRVINSQGKISYRSSANEQRRLLEAEGIPFDDRERVDLKRFGWGGPSIDWLRDNGLIYPEGPQQASLF
jgi:methylated-DNA-protein-cysteine methyltransferase-like protein